MLPEYQTTGFDCSKTQTIDLPDFILEKIKEDLEYTGYL